MIGLLSVVGLILIAVGALIVGVETSEFLRHYRFGVCSGCGAFGVLLKKYGICEECATRAA